MDRHCKGDRKRRKATRSSDEINNSEQPTPAVPVGEDFQPKETPCQKEDSTHCDATSSPESLNELLDISTTFSELEHGLIDRRIVKALSNKFGFTHPTLIQSKAIPLILKGKDILTRARTGTGKTLLYAVPILHKLLEAPDLKSYNECLRVLILVPTRELCRQVAKVFASLCEYCHEVITVMDIAENLKYFATRGTPSILVATPKAFIDYLKQKGETSKFDQKLKMKLVVIVLDEADALMGLGYKNDLEHIFTDIVSSSSTPATHQTILCSATLNADVDYLKSLTLHKPVILKFEDGDYPQKCNLTEYYISCPSKDRYLVLYSMLKLQLVPLKCLVFTTSAQTAYSISIFLRRLGIISSVICSTLPFSSRREILESFNQSLIKLLIATDETLEDESDGDSESEKKESYSRKDKSYGIHRGIDIQGLRCVINFDIPFSAKSYVHRIGRTSRAGKTGYALTLSSSDHDSENKILDDIIEARKDNTLGNDDSKLKPLLLDLRDIECFRYRVEDVLRSVTPKVIKASRCALIQQQILNAKSLSEHFENNPEDAIALKKALSSLQLSKNDSRHLQTLPSYFRPAINKLTPQTAVESAVANLEDITIQKRKRRDVLNEFGVYSSKRMKLDKLLVRQLAKEPDYSMTAPSNLPAISGRKIYRIQKKKPIKKSLPTQPGIKRKRKFMRKKIRK